MLTLNDLYQLRLNTPWNINEHMPILRDYAADCDIVTELGVERGFSTISFLAGQPLILNSVDVIANPDLEQFKYMSEVHDFFSLGGDSFRLMVKRTQWHFLRTDDLAIALNPCDMLFIDSNHTYWQLRMELRLHSRHVAKWILLHDTEAFALQGMDGSVPGMSEAIQEFVGQGEFRIFKHYPNNHGLTVLERKR